jgi:O-6-methylguanine DNA methyltransferase
MPDLFQLLKVQTSWGLIQLELHNETVIRCSLPLLNRQPEKKLILTAPAGDRITEYIGAVLTGRKTSRPPIATPQGTAFQKQVWKAISLIPGGQTVTYGELAEMINKPRAVRAVGTACGRNPLPLFIPCHRVTAAEGRLGGFSAGLPWKRYLLAIEN